MSFFQNFKKYYFLLILIIVRSKSYPNNFIKKFNYVFAIFGPIQNPVKMLLFFTIFSIQNFVSSI